MRSKIHWWAASMSLTIVAGGLPPVDPALAAQCLGVECPAAVPLYPAPADVPETGAPPSSEVPVEVPPSTAPAPVDPAHLASAPPGTDTAGPADSAPPPVSGAPVEPAPPTPAVVPGADPAPPSSTPGETPEKTSRETPEKTPRETPEKTPRETPEGPPGDTGDTEGTPDGRELYFENCDAAREAGVAPMKRGEPGYRVALDANRDGLACTGKAGSGTPGPGIPGPGPSDPGNPGPGIPGTDLPAGGSAAQLHGWGTPTRVEQFDDPALPGWNRYDGPGHAGRGVRSPQAISARDGLLTIRGDEPGTTGGMAWDLSARYGRYEARVRAPVGNPSYNALLLLWPTAEDFPVGGEIDFMEMTDPTRRSVEGFLHYGPDNSQVQGRVAVDATQWHDWAVEWTPTRVTAYLDGRAWWVVDRPDILPPRPMHLAVQLDWFPRAGAAGGAQMQVDWIRYYAVRP